MIAPFPIGWVYVVGSTEVPTLYSATDLPAELLDFERRAREEQEPGRV